jgi:hypothetical protein
MNNKKAAYNFNVDDHTWKFAYDAIGESVYNSIISSVRIISTSLWDFGWDAVDVGVDTSLRDEVWHSVNDYFRQK